MKTFVLPSPEILPKVEQAVSAYRSEGGCIGFPEVFGIDLLAGRQELQKLRLNNFSTMYPNFEVFFHSLVNGNHTPFQQGLLFFIDLTTSLYPN